MSVLEEWLAAVAAELGLPDGAGADVAAQGGTRDVVLDVARDAAHGVARPAAPLTTYLLGLAVGQGGVDPADAAARLSALATGWDGGSEGVPQSP